jgi:hypothetical protein
MLAAILLAAGLAPTTFGVLMPKFNSSDPEFSFDLPNTSVEEGFKIPEGIPNGVYTVSINSDGVAHYQRHDLPTDTYQDEMEGGEALDAPPSGLVERASWSYHCGDKRPLNKQSTDHAVRWLKGLCSYDEHGAGQGVVPPSVRYEIAIIYDVAAYFCNFDKRPHICKPDEIDTHLRGRVAQKCGAYRSGWANWDGRISIGHQWVDHTWTFCGKSHA